MKKNILSILLIVGVLIISSFTVSGINIEFSTSVIYNDYYEGEPFNNNDIQTPFPGEMGDNAPNLDIIYENVLYPTPDLGTLSPSGDLDGLVWQIDIPTVKGYIETLENFGPRVTGSPAVSAAGDYIYGVFQSMGLEVRKQPWSSGYYSGNNIEGTLYGEDETSDEIYIVCAHYDSVPGSPGADDNGAGTAAVLAAAGVMSQFKWNYTVRFVTFDGEEQGLLGSHYYAQEASFNGDNIVAVLNADMIGYAETSDDASKVKLYTNSGSNWLVSYTADVSSAYNNLIGLSIINSGSTSGSDHYSFWQFGYSAVFYHEFKFNIYYHSPNDISAHMNMGYDMRVSRLIMATLGELAIFNTEGGGGNGSGIYVIPPFVKITDPLNGESVNDTIVISGNGYDYKTNIRYVYVKIGDSSWLEADIINYGDGMTEWSIPWNTNTVEDGPVVISAVSINREGIQSPVNNIIVNVKNEDEEPEPIKTPDLTGEGSISWSGIKPKLVVSGEFTLENIGDPESELDWEVVDTPDWGDWTFTPNEGYDLNPEDGIFSVDVILVAPEEKNQEFTGEVKVVNKEDISDYITIPVSLVTSKNKGFEIYPLLIRFLEQYTMMFPLLRHILQL